MDKDQPPTIKDLYPHLTEKELQEAEDNLDRYLELILRIHDRLRLYRDGQNIPSCRTSTTPGGTAIIPATKVEPKETAREQP